MPLFFKGLTGEAARLVPARRGAIQYLEREWNGGTRRPSHMRPLPEGAAKKGARGRVGRSVRSRSVHPGHGNAWSL